MGGGRMKRAILTMGNPVIREALALELHSQHIQTIQVQNWSQLSQLPKGYYDTCYDLANMSLSNIATDLFQISTLLKTCSRLGCNRYIGVGSIGEKEVISLMSRSEEQLQDRFTVHQLVAHCMGQYAANQLHIEFLWALPVGIYGTCLSVGEIPRLIEQLQSSDTLQLDGAEQICDFLHINDFVRALVAIGQRGIGDTEYIISSQNPKKRMDFVTILKQILGCDTHIIWSNTEQVHSLPISLYQNTRLEQHTGFYPQVSFYEGIQSISD